MDTVLFSLEQDDIEFRMYPANEPGEHYLGLGASGRWPSVFLKPDQELHIRIRGPRCEIYWRNPADACTEAIDHTEEIALHLGG